MVKQGGGDGGHLAGLLEPAFCATWELEGWRWELETLRWELLELWGWMVNG